MLVDPLADVVAALARGVRVIPVLVDGARMPRREQLPPSLGKLAARQALELSHARFRADLGPMLRVLDKTLGSQTALPGTRPLPSRADAAPGAGPESEAQRNDPDTVVAAVLARLET
jgi:hypothetical protein